MSDYIYANGELYHYGIKGMKWGVRRYQNKDGSLTSAGKKRANDKAHYQGLTEEGREQAKRVLKKTGLVALAAPATLVTVVKGQNLVASIMANDLRGSLWNAAIFCLDAQGTKYIYEEIAK